MLYAIIQIGMGSHFTGFIGTEKECKKILADITNGGLCELYGLDKRGCFELRPITQITKKETEKRLEIKRKRELIKALEKELGLE